MAEKIIDNSQVGVRSIHSMPFNWLGTADFGRLVPFHWQELIGTDKVVTCHPQIELQMLPLASPTFGKMDVYVHYFFVPTRLLWSDFNDFYSRSGVGQNATPPYITKQQLCQLYTTQGYGVRAYYKHWTSLGLPPFFASEYYNNANTPSSVKDKRLSLLPFRAYNQIWWDFYRDPELISDASKSQYITTTGGAFNTLYGIQYLSPHIRQNNRTWLADLFATSGTDSGVLGAIDIAGTDLNPAISGTQTNPLRFDPITGKVAAGSNVPSSATSVIGQTDSQTIRQMEALTRMAERLSLGGKRQIERLFAQYGIKPQFTKLQMCEYIGGSKASVLVSDITSSADTTGLYDQGQAMAQGSPLGAKAGAGYCAFNNLNIEYEAKEPGYLMGILSIMPHVHYIQGIGKEWYRNSLEDWFTRQLEHTGMIAVPKEEIGVFQPHYNPLPENDEQTFAFTQPYYEYKRNTDKLAGDFMLYHDDSGEGSGSDEKDLQYMHSMGLFQHYPENRLYNADNMKVDEIQANKVFYYLGGSVWDDSDDHFHVNIDVDIKINRPMDGFAVPTLETTSDPHAASAPIGGDKML